MPLAIGRRRFVASTLSLLGLTLALPALGAPAAAATPKKLRERTGSTIGTTLRFELENAPYPAENGKYTDASVIVFVPARFRLPRSGKVDFVVHLHGHATTAARAVAGHKLREQLDESRQNAVLVVPQGPVNAADGDFGKLMRPGGLAALLGEVLREASRKSAGAGLAKASGVGRVILSAHSGGYRAAAACLATKLDLREVFLFDALYGEWETFARWLAEEPETRKLVSYYVGGRPRELSLALAGWLTEHGVAVTREGGASRLSRRELTRARAAFLEGHVAHGAATYEEHALRDCLLASCLKGRGSRAWHEAGDKARAT